MLDGSPGKMLTSLTRSRTREEDLVLEAKVFNKPGNREEDTRIKARQTYKWRAKASKKCKHFYSHHCLL